MGEGIDKPLRGPNLLFRRIGSAIRSERDRVRHRVITDLVPGVVRAFGLAAKFRLPQFSPNDKETRFHVVARQHRQHGWSDLLMRAIVEGQRDASHFVLSWP